MWYVYESLFSGVSDCSDHNAGQRILSAQLASSYAKQHALEESSTRRSNIDEAT